MQNGNVNLHKGIKHTRNGNNMSNYKTFLLFKSFLNIVDFKAKIITKFVEFTIHV